MQAKLQFCATMDAIVAIFCIQISHFFYPVLADKIFSNIDQNNKGYKQAMNKLQGQRFIFRIIQISTHF